MTLEQFARGLRRIAEVIEPPESSYALARFLFLRALGLVYCIAFLVLVRQVLPLLGEHGILPVSLYLERTQDMAEIFTVSPYRHVPTLFWLGHSDGVLLGMAYLGLALSILLLAGVSNAVLIGALWVLYFSYDQVGQIFYGFGWEILLLEATFLAIFLCPVWRIRPFCKTPPPSKTIMWLYRWLVFRVMFGAGLIKLRADPCWWDLSCLVTHYETQPIPNPVSWYLHQLPLFAHQAGVLWNHVVELIAPLLLFGPRRARIVAASLIVLFQLILMISGNLSFLNLLTIAICIPCFDDRFWIRRMPRSTWRALCSRCRGVAPSRRRRVVVAGLAVVIGLLSVGPAMNMLSPGQVMNRSFDPLYLVNSYGAFGSIGRVRHEIVLSGTTEADPRGADAVWIEYEFKAKPGDVTHRPPFLAPYHLRLDWQIWFAAMSTYEDQPWFVHFVYKLLEGDPRVLSLLDGNPFPDGPPATIRADLYEYRFTRLGDGSNAWWQRERLGPYLAPVSLNSPALLDFLREYGWLELETVQPSDPE